jgi:hypothetical protein
MTRTVCTHGCGHAAVALALVCDRAAPNRCARQSFCPLFSLCVSPSRPCLGSVAFVKAVSKMSRFAGLTDLISHRTVALNIFAAVGCAPIASFHSADLPVHGPRTHCPPAAALVQLSVMRAPQRLEFIGSPPSFVAVGPFGDLFWRPAANAARTMIDQCRSPQCVHDGRAAAFRVCEVINAVYGSDRSDRFGCCIIELCACSDWATDAGHRHSRRCDMTVRSRRGAASPAAPGQWPRVGFSCFGSHWVGRRDAMHCDAMRCDRRCDARTERRPIRERHIDAQRLQTQTQRCFQKSRWDEVWCGSSHTHSGMAMGPRLRVRFPNFLT